MSSPIPPPSPTPSATVGRLFTRLRDRTGLVVGVVLAVTALLVVPFLALAPTESASTEPGGDVFTARDRVDDTFVSSVAQTFFVAEHDSGDLLRADPLRTLLAANERLRNDPELGGTLFTYVDVDTGLPITGVRTLAELVDLELADAGGLATATDADVKAAADTLVERFGERSDELGFSAASTRGDDGWIVPAVSFVVLSDNDALGFGNASVNLGGGTEREEYDRSVQDVLRSAEGYQVNGIAIDVNLTSQEQGALAGPFIGFTILAVLVIVGLTFRSYWVMATVSAALVLLIIWLKGISNLIGLEDDLVLSLIVPIAMVSFGVDFAFHAVGRYREERVEGRTAAVAVAGGLTAVSGALVLALVSDVTAFLANTTSGIESIVQFGLGAAIALVAAYLLLGIVTPLVIAAIEQEVPAPTPGRRSTVLRVLAAIGTASLAMAAVLMLVFVLPWVGVILTAVLLVTTVVVPFALCRRRSGVPVGSLPVSDGASALAAPVGRVVAAIARRPAVVLPLALVTTVVAAGFAIRVPAEFDVEDFFSPDTDFVQGLDQIDEHVGDRGGEPAVVYIEGDLTDPAALAAVDRRLDEIRALDTDLLARTDGDVRVDGGVISIFEAAGESPVMASVVAEQTGVVLTDDDGDGIPDDRTQVEALLAVAVEIGVPLDEQRSLLTPDDVQVRVALGADGAVDRTSVELGLVDSRTQESVAEARRVLEPVAAALSADLGGTFVQVTGSPFVREASLDATNDALQLSLPIALVLCLLVAAVFLRSIRYGLASIVPIVMVVAWLYAFMEIAGYSINLVTATIAAVSVGIGVDFAIHFIARYREELERRGRRHDAVRAAGEGTGVALIASAFSSAVGFGILALAPMPLFAAYGLLTALMIGLALVATLAVLPAVLVAITRDAGPVDLTESASLQPDHGEEEPDATEDGDRTPELGTPPVGQLV